MRYDNIIPFTYQRYVIKNTIDIRTLYEQNDHEYVIGTVLWDSDQQPSDYHNIVL